MVAHEGRFSDNLKAIEAGRTGILAVEPENPLYARLVGLGPSEGAQVKCVSQSRSLLPGCLAALSASINIRRARPSARSCPAVTTKLLSKFARFTQKGMALFSCRQRSTTFGNSPGPAVHVALLLHEVVAELVKISKRAVEICSGARRRIASYKLAAIHNRACKLISDLARTSRRSFFSFDSANKALER
jgi:hypothetical protein